MVVISKTVGMAGSYQIVRNDSRWNNTRAARINEITVIRAMLMM
jgi:hypothetical protein